MEAVSILDQPTISDRYLFQQDRSVDDPFMVKADGAELACYRKFVDPDAFTMIHFHGNGEAVADYVPFMADTFADMGLNSLFVEYREYGGSTGEANPLLTLHTENDGLIDISHAERNHKWASSLQKQLVRFPNGNHNTIFGANETEYLKAVASFVGSVQR